MMNCKSVKNLQRDFLCSRIYGMQLFAQTLLFALAMTLPYRKNGSFFLRNCVHNYERRLDYGIELLSFLHLPTNLIPIHRFITNSNEFRLFTMIFKGFVGVHFFLCVIPCTIHISTPKKIKTSKVAFFLVNIKMSE